MIAKQLDQIIKDLEHEEPDEQYRECAIYIKDIEDSVNFIVDKKHFGYEVDNEWLYVRWNGGDEDTGVIIYCHTVKVSQIVYITSEV